MAETEPPPVLAESAPAAPAPNAEDLPKQKRGFWSKLFGRGKDDRKK
jgi:hypothetical protein